MFHAVRAMETITFCLATFACILMTMYVFSEMSRRQSVAITLMVICISAGNCFLQIVSSKLPVTNYVIIDGEIALEIVPNSNNYMYDILSYFY